jgi:hypothetical protein
MKAPILLLVVALLSCGCAGKPDADDAAANERAAAAGHVETAELQMQQRELTLRR